MVELAPRDLSLLLDMVIAARDARSFVDGLDEPAFLASRLHQNAVIRSLEVIGEAANTLTPACRAALPDIPWRQIIGLRHRRKSYNVKVLEYGPDHAQLPKDLERLLEEVEEIRATGLGAEQVAAELPESGAGA